MAKNSFKTCCGLCSGGGEGRESFRQHHLARGLFGAGRGCQKVMAVANQGVSHRGWLAEDTAEGGGRLLHYWRYSNTF